MTLRRLPILTVALALVACVGTDDVPVGEGPAGQGMVADTPVADPLAPPPSARIAYCRGAGNVAPQTETIDTTQPMTLRYPGLATLTVEAADWQPGTAGSLRIYAPPSPFLQIEIDALDPQGNEIPDFRFAGDVGLEINKQRCGGSVPADVQILQVDGEDLDARPTQPLTPGGNELTTTIEHLSDFLLGWP